MQNLGQKTNEINIKLSTEELTSTQVRLIKSIHALMAHVLTAEDEPEYFETSADLLKKTAELIKHSSFAQQNKEMSYGDQAVEFAVDYLNETLEGNKLHNIDN
jgi:cyclopropane fatty-acyl-phospholipid synthase-like methyltransferase